MCRSAWWRRGATVLLLALLAAWPADAAAQACCGANGLVIPARLRVYDDYGFGVQATERQTYGSLAADGSYSGTSNGDLVTEQDLFAMARLSSRSQFALLVPYVETYRRIPGQSEWGGFFGDLTVSGRFEVAHSGEHGAWPAVTILAGLTFPTGRAPDQAHNALGTDAAGTGSFQGNLGLELERLFRHWFVMFDGWVSQRTSRASPGGRQSFAPRLTALLAGGYVFDNRLAAGAFATAVDEGNGRDTAPGAGEVSGPRYATTGLAGAIPVAEAWRLQATASADLPLGGWGRNQPTTFAFSTSLVRVWP
jgi:hypothetical protein